MRRQLAAWNVQLGWKAIVSSAMSGPPLASNPFAALFTGAAVPPAATAAAASGTTIPAASTSGDISVGLIKAAPAVATTVTAAVTSAQDDAVQAQLRLSYYFERVLVTTLDGSTIVVGAPAQRPLHCVFLQDLFASLQQDWIDIDLFGQVLFDRLLVPDPGGCIVRTSPLASSDRPSTDAALQALTEHRVIHFLWQTYRRTVSSRLGFESSVAADVLAKCQDLVVDSAVTSLLQPAIFEGQQPAEQLADIMIDGYFGEDGELLQAMLDKLVAALVLNDDGASTAADAEQPKDRRSPLYNAFCPLLLRIWRECTRLCVGQLPGGAWNGAKTAGADILVFFTRHPHLGELLVDFSTPLPPATPPVGAVPSPGSGAAAAAATAVPGVHFEQSLLGLLLSGSSMPSRFGLGSGMLQLYSDVAQLTQVEVNSREASVWQGLVGIADRAFNLFRELLKLSPEVRHRLLDWIGACLHANSGRTKLAAMLYDDVSGSSPNDCSDGFMLNLSAVLLRLCRPFVSGGRVDDAADRTSQAASVAEGRPVPRDAQRLLFRIQPEYCFYQRPDVEAERRRRCHHAPAGLASQTSLVPREDAASLLPEPAEYAGVTEFFFLTQVALHLGFHASVEKFFKSNSDLSRLQGAYQQARQSFSAFGGSGGQDSAVKIMFENEMRKFLSMKASLTEPDYLESCLRFHAASASYLVHLAASENPVSATGSGADQPCDASRSIGGCSPLVRARLSCVPEFVVTNIADTLTLVKRFKESLLQVLGADGLGRIMDLILVFMGSKERLKNPHLRARLAIVLEDLLPIDASAGGNAGSGSSFATAFSGQMYEQLFTSHRNVSCLAETLINVFVSIEMTGEGVRFEEKFNYRRPMYKVMDYIWSIELHRDAIKELCRAAETRMSDVDPPLFLRFINLLVNDAIYLLDEALSYMRQIREKEEEQERRTAASASAALDGGPSADGHLTTVPSPQQSGTTAAGVGGVAAAIAQRRQQMEQQRQQQEQEAMVQHMNMLARFHNMLGADTIHTLALLTSECQSIFCHTVMVDRVAAMLNYFLLHLTGPNMKQFKVKNFEKYDFKPRLVVSNICQIYLNLGASPAFCAAVSGDGRSYSSSLFPQAARVLEKIGKPIEMIDAFRALADRIQAAASRQQEEDACLGEAPDEFLDPIMGTLMKDPVVLPSSRVTVDRSTIARHILSDQTDPFNRSPLSLDMVEPDHSLREKIEAWLASKLQAAAAAKRPQPPT